MSDAGILAIYDFEGVFTVAVAKVLSDGGFTALHPLSDPQFQKNRPRVEVFFKLSGEVFPIRLAVQADASQRNAAWTGELSLHAITDCNTPGKAVHSTYRAQLRYFCANIGDKLNGVPPGSGALLNHKIQQILETGTEINLKIQDGYEVSRITYKVDFSVQADAWALLTQ